MNTSSFLKVLKSSIPEDQAPWKTSSMHSQLLLPLAKIRYKNELSFTVLADRAKRNSVASMLKHIDKSKLHPTQNVGFLSAVAKTTVKLLGYLLDQCKLRLFSQADVSRYRQGRSSGWERACSKVLAVEPQDSLATHH